VSAPNTPIPDDMCQELEKAWNGVLEKVPTDQATQVLLGGVNLRFNLIQTFKAAWYVAKVYLHGHIIASTGNANPLDLMSITSDTFSAVVSTLNAFRDPLEPLDYTTCVVLSQSSDGMTSDDLEAKLNDFLIKGEQIDFPWYLGLTQAYKDNAATELRTNKKLPAVLEKLKKRGYLEEADGVIKFRSRHFTLGLRDG